NRCSAVRCWTSAEITSDASPVTRLPRPTAARPAKPSGRPAKRAVRLNVPRGMSSSITRLCLSRGNNSDAEQTGTPRLSPLLARPLHHAPVPEQGAPVQVKLEPDEGRPAQVGVPHRGALLGCL